MKTYLLRVFSLVIILHVAFAQGGEEALVDFRRGKEAVDLRKDVDAFTTAVEKWHGNPTIEAYGQNAIRMAKELIERLEKIALSYPGSRRLLLPLIADLKAVEDLIATGFNFELRPSTATSDVAEAFKSGAKRDQTFLGLLAASAILASDAKRNERQRELVGRIGVAFHSFLEGYRSAGGVDNYFMDGCIGGRSSPFGSWGPLGIMNAQFGLIQKPNLKPIVLVSRLHEDGIMVITGYKPSDYVILTEGTEVGTLRGWLREDFAFILTPDGKVGQVFRANCKLLLPLTEYERNPYAPIDD